MIMDFNPKDLINNEIPLEERINLFNKLITKYGVQDEHILSNILKVKPQIIIAFYELNSLDEEEIDFLNRKNLDIGIVSVLMNIQPEIRKHIYRKLDYFMKSNYPVSEILNYINNGGWNYSISSVYTETDRDFWGEVSSYLKDKSVDSGTINKKFRSLLISIKKNSASKKQLEWLERGIIYDYEEHLGIFTAETFKLRYPEAVNNIQKYINYLKKL
jgi:hypothetical protein